MPGKIHEFRDPVHVFIRLESAERDVVDSPPFQRLRDIHQLALTYLIYPGATHKRFEHSLGVMEVATRIYDTVTAPQNIWGESVRNLIPNDGFEHGYWRRALRMAALLHDVGHLPFSHAAEELLPEGSNHETISQTLIEGDLAGLLDKALHVNPAHVARLALGNKYRGGPEFDPWERILSEIIVGNAFGADRIDYLLRDSLHAGVSYGRFDHHRLIDTLRILPGGLGQPPSLGIEEGGIHAAEALVWARYFMYAQVYFHPVRRIYDIHLKEFLQHWLPNGQFSTNSKQHLKMTDSEVLSAIRRIAGTPRHAAHEAAKRISSRKHYRLLFQPTALERSSHPEGFKELGAALDSVHPGKCRMDPYISKPATTDFPVRLHDGQIESSIVRSSTLLKSPQLAVDYLFIDPIVRDDAQSWLKSERSKFYPPEAVAKPGERDKATGPAHHDESPATSPPVRHRRNRQNGGIPPDRNDA